jgi:kynureninase
MTIDLSDFRREAALLDASDPAPMRDRFEFPPAAASSGFATRAYFAGNSLGLLPTPTRAVLDEVMSSWSTRAVEGHFMGAAPWTELAESLSTPMARIVGGLAHETIVANTLTVNVHLLLLAFYRPAGDRTILLTEDGPFPSDGYAAASHARMHNLDPGASIVKLAPREDEMLLRTNDILAAIERLGDRLACVLLPGIAFRTGQLLDIPTITAAAHSVGATVIWDLAHAAGNVPLALHDWGVDGAAWCTYKYLNSGPGAVGAMFLHERHVDRTDLVRLDGWWGNAPETRFAMSTEIDRGAGAVGWQISNPPVLAVAPIRSSLAIFDEAGGVPVLRERSKRLTGYLERVLAAVASGHQVDIITSSDPDARGAQLSVLVDDAKHVTERLIAEHDVLPDERPPSIIRFAPIPLYSSYEECWRAGAALAAVLPNREQQLNARRGTPLERTGQ